MNMKRFIAIVLMFVLALTLVGCELSASKGPDSGATATTQPPVPDTNVPGDQNMGDMGTQTAIAQTPPPAMTSTPLPQPDVAPTNPPPTPMTTRPETYELQKGEFPYCLARRFDVNPSDLLRVNNLTSSSRTYVGQELKIPQSGSFPENRSLRAHPAEYTVQTGDTVYMVACYYGDVYPESIIAANGLTEPYTLTPGNKISIP
ncbi:MAG: LysM peptidoglycan-binding domain-containing protein [Chloroflexota bacterium]